MPLHFHCETPQELEQWVSDFKIKPNLIRALITGVGFIFPVACNVGDTYWINGPSNDDCAACKEVLAKEELLNAKCNAPT